MPRPSTWDDEDRIDPNILAILGVARRQLFRRRRHPFQTMMVERHGCRIVAGALLDLDEGNGPPPLGDQVNLTAADARPRRQYPPAVEAQPPGGDRLGAATAPFRLGTVQRFDPSSRARA
jgi:hypothetical protein